ncbi:hypothetical protein T459_27141 [Capsicum annuum]|uniref:Uncharacterized protein n=1 Tax=Capsicum annuum TaxID=4072 RepID=A0A2G2YD40_CAPAN|nr:hypothetical protein T459_27141 [Capsicum annuum]
MVASTADKNLIVFNLQNPQTEFKRIPSPLKYQTRCLTAFPDQQGFLVGSIEGRVGVHHLDDSLEASFSINFAQFSNVASFGRHMERLQLRDLTVPSTFGTKIANRGLRQCQDVASPYLAVRSTVMAQSMHMRFVMIGARAQKIIIHQLQKHLFTCTSHRSLTLRASHELQVAVESEVSSKASSHYFGKSWVLFWTWRHLCFHFGGFPVAVLQQLICLE